jgi:YVTN family beta-propeller protein
MRSDGHRRLPLLGLRLALAPFPVSAGEVRVYITDSGGDSVDAIDPATNKIVQVITGVEVPHGINFSADGSRIYVSNESRNVLDIIERDSGRIIGEVPLSGHPNNIAITKNGRRVLVAINNGGGALDVIDTAAQRLAKSIPVDGPLRWLTWLPSLSPNQCRCTSATSVRLGSGSMASASLIDGKEPAGNRTSSTVPCAAITSPDMGDAPSPGSHAFTSCSKTGAFFLNRITGVVAR